MIIPSIDLMGGKAVQLENGKKKILERDNFMELAKEFSVYGEIAVIDLDSAMSKGDNLGIIKEICRNYNCRVGGGIRTIKKAEKILSYGAKKIIIGTNADKKFLELLPKEKVIVAIDTKDDFVVNKGWRNKTNKKPEEMIKKLEEYCSEFLFTNVNREGMMRGINFSIVEKLKKVTKNKMTIAGGISSIDEIKRLEKMNLNSQIGMAIYAGKVSLEDSFISILDFEKSNGLIPTIVQDYETKQVLMLSYSNEESLKKLFEKKRGTYYSRSRKKMWTKGETSGNYQDLIKVRYDCDRDTLLFQIKQENAACHEGNYSCFGEGDKEFNFNELYETIRNRIDNPRKSSYTSKISKNEDLIKEKIFEECREILNYKNKENLIWEISDLAYFMIVLMAKKGIKIEDVKNELEKRRLMKK